MYVQVAHGRLDTDGAYRMSRNATSGPTNNPLHQRHGKFVDSQHPIWRNRIILVALHMTDDHPLMPWLIFRMIANEDMLGQTESGIGLCVCTVLEVVVCGGCAHPTIAIAATSDTTTASDSRAMPKSNQCGDRRMHREYLRAKQGRKPLEGQIPTVSMITRWQTGHGQLEAISRKFLVMMMLMIASFFPH